MCHGRQDGPLFLLCLDAVFMQQILLSCIARCYYPYSRPVLLRCRPDPTTASCRPAVVHGQRSLSYQSTVRPQSGHSLPPVLQHTRAFLSRSLVALVVALHSSATSYLPQQSRDMHGAEQGLPDIASLFSSPDSMACAGRSVTPTKMFKLPLTSVSNEPDSLNRDPWAGQALGLPAGDIDKPHAWLQLAYIAIKRSEPYARRPTAWLIASAWPRPLRPSDPQALTSARFQASCSHLQTQSHTESHAREYQAHFGKPPCMSLSLRR